MRDYSPRRERGGDRDRMPRGERGGYREWDIKCKVYVGNLGNSASKHEIESAFNKYGTLRNVWVARNPPGFAFVEYNDYRDAEDAVRALDGTRVCGTRIRVEMSSGRTRRDEGRGGRGSRRDDRGSRRDRGRDRNFHQIQHHNKFLDQHTTLLSSLLHHVLGTLSRAFILLPT